MDKVYYISRAGSFKNEPAFLFLTINYRGNESNNEWKWNKL